MPSRHRSEKKRAHEVDVKGIAVALAILVSIGVLAGGRDDRRVGEDRQSPSVSMQLTPALTMENAEALQHPDEEADHSDTSRKLSASR